MFNKIKSPKILIILGLLLLILFIFKDNLYITGLFFYAFPIPIIILFALVLTYIFRRKKIYNLSLLTLSILLISHWFIYYYKWQQPPKGKLNKTLLYWNVAKHTDFNIKDLETVLEGTQPDIIVLVEAINTSDLNLKHLQDILSNYHLKFLEGQMFFASKQPVGTINYNSESKNYKFNIVDFSIDNNNYKIGITDVYAHPFHNKKYALSDIISLSQQNDIDFIVGDFNTPYESTYFEFFKKDYHSARIYQNGFTSTWPYGIPLLELDQIWVKTTIPISSLEKNYFSSSDHAMLILKF